MKKTKKLFNWLDEKTKRIEALYIKIVFAVSIPSFIALFVIIANKEHISENVFNILTSLIPLIIVLSLFILPLLIFVRLFIAVKNGIHNLRECDDELFDKIDYFLDYLKENIKKYAPIILRLTVLSLPLGVACGLVGTAFVKAIILVTDFRGAHPWVLYLLPVLGVILTLVFKVLKVKGVGTNHIINSVRTSEGTSPLLSVAIFTGTVLSHLGGASVGREGAALQLGGSMGELLSRLLKVGEPERRVIVMSGMAGCFSALFGTPFAAFIFVLEVVRVGRSAIKSIVPVFVSSVVAFATANLLGVEPERFHLAQIPEFSFNTVCKMLVITVLGAVVSMGFVYALHTAEKGFKRLIKNDFIKVMLGGVAIILLTKLFGTTDYNGGGIDVVHHIFTDGEVRYEAFLLKILFTAISVGMGFKGGEIVPTIFVGGTFGGACALFLGLDPAFGAAIGITALFSGVTNCPTATLVLACEMFGLKGAGYFAVASAIAFALSGKVSLYSGRKLPFVKNK